MTTETEIETETQSWMWAGATLTVIVQWLGNPSAVVVVCTIVAVLAIAAALVSRRSYPLALVSLLVAVGLIPFTGIMLIQLLLVALIVFASALVLSRRLAFVVALAATAACAGATALTVTTVETIQVTLTVFTLSCLCVQLVTSTRQHPNTPQIHYSDAESREVAGPTRVELNRIKGELDRATSLLREAERSRQDTESKLLEAFRIKEAFLATMSHELRTPLNQIIGYSELLIEEVEDTDPTELRGDVSRIQEAAKNLFDIIANVLEQSQIESGALTTNPEPIEVDELVERLLYPFATQARSRNNTLRLRCPNDIGVIVSDIDKLQTILKNLLSNACKFTQNGTIRLSVERIVEQDKPIYAFVVSDTGIGIEPSEMERLFRPFEQADPSTTRRFDGAGLGLAVSRNLAVILGGTLTAESQPGKGSRFELRIPQDWESVDDADLIVRSFLMAPQAIAAQSGSRKRA